MPIRFESLPRQQGSATLGSNSRTTSSSIINSDRKPPASRTTLSTNANDDSSSSTSPNTEAAYQELATINTNNTAVGAADIAPPPVTTTAAPPPQPSESNDKASSTPTPPSTLSSSDLNTTITDQNNYKSSSLSSSSGNGLDVEELRQQRTFLERLQDLWYERSGTSEILALKESVNDASLAFDQASTKVTLARRHLDTSIKEWEQTSGQHLQLLQRRESWNADDAQKFATLISQEISTRKALEQARKDLALSEATLSQRQLEYMNRMRRRYHEEQIWQDQWRVLGTYGTWSLIVLNSVVFLGSQYFLQQREMARMKAIEELVIRGLQQQQSLVQQQTAAADDIAPQLSKASSSSSSDKTALVEEKLQPTEPNYKKSWRQWQQNFQTTGLDLWNKVRTHSGEALKSLQLKSLQSLAATPGWKELPKSFEEVHVPSAVVGASVTGVAAIAVVLLLQGGGRR